MNIVYCTIPTLLGIYMYLSKSFIHKRQRTKEINLHQIGCREFVGVFEYEPNDVAVADFFKAANKMKLLN